MPRNRKIISAAVFVNLVALVYFATFQNDRLEYFVDWLNRYDLKNGYLLDAARVFQMCAISICSVQLADFLSAERPGRRYWLMLFPFPFAFTYYFAQVATVESDVFPRYGLIGINFLVGAILLSYSAMLGFMKERCK